MINNVKDLADFANDVKEVYYSFTDKMGKLAGEYYADTHGTNAYEWPDLTEEQIDQLNKKLAQDKQNLIDGLINGFKHTKYKKFIVSFLDQLSEDEKENALHYPQLGYTADGKLEDPVDALTIFSDAHLYKVNLIFDVIDSDDKDFVKEELLKRYKDILDKQAEIIIEKEINREELEVFWDVVFFVNLKERDNPTIAYYYNFITRKYKQEDER